MEPTANQWQRGRGRQEARASVASCWRPASRHFSTTASKATSAFRSKAARPTIAMIEELLERAAAANVREVVIGMAHRGRLTLLANVVGKGMAQMFSEFEGDIDPEINDGQGDVKYHLGATSTRTMSNGKDDHGLRRRQSQPSGSRESGGGGHRSAQAGPPERRPPGARDSAADPRRRGHGRPGNRGRDAQFFADRRLRHRRHHPPGDQQPDRLHHQSARAAARRRTAPTLR